MLKIAPGTKDAIPHTTDLHQMLHVPREKTLSQCPTPARICVLTPLDAGLTMRFAKNTQRDTSEVLHPPRKMTMEVSKVIRLPRKMQLIFGKPCKSIALVTQNDLGRFCRHVRMSASATPATQNGMTTCFDTFENDRSCSFSHRHGDGRRKPENRDETCWSFKTSISCETASNFHTS